VSVGREAAVWRDFVIVPEPQRAPPGICVRWGEMMAGFEPVSPITGKRMKGPTFDHGLSPKFCPVTWPQHSNLKIEASETLGFRKCTLQVKAKHYFSVSAKGMFCIPAARTRPGRE
jgi:hypothetical protein